VQEVSAVPLQAAPALTLATAPSIRRPPAPRAGVLRRERLLRRLAASTDIPLVLLVAPAGYGKTTLLAQWVEREPRPVAWISVDGDQADALAAVADSIDDLERPFAIVLDDAHRLSAPESLEALAALADSVPDGSQLVLSSREEPALPVGRLRAHGRLVDLRTRDLAMTRREAAVMLSLAGLELAPEDVAVLLQRTEGWPAGLYLAALSLRDQSDVHRAVAAFAGDDRLTADYLRDELLDDLDPATRTFMWCTSVLDTLSGPLCDAVLDRKGSGAVLRDLSRSNALVVPLDSTDATYRYHPLLARMLRAELGREDRGREGELHRRASAWYAAAGELDLAIGHAIDAGETARAGELMWSAAADHVLGGRTAPVRRWLDRFTREEIAAHPTLALTAAASHLACGERDLVEHWTAAAERAAGEKRPACLAAGIAVLRAAVARDGIEQMAADAETAYELAAPDSPWLSLCCLLRGVADHLRGDAAAARELLEEGARRGAIAAPTIQVLCLAQLTLLALDEGDWEQGALLATRARAQVERVGLTESPTCALVFAVSALVRAHRDRVEVAQADRRRAIDLQTRLVDYVPWYDVEARVALARTALRLGDVTGTRTLLGEASRMLARSRDAVRLREWTDDLWSQVDAFSVTALVGPSSLTTAELRVLALLPTHLSFREMGRTLHVSANTIKTHAHSVYRKLDVCSRSEAVVRARETGLLDAEASTASTAAGIVS
jgi:LuxR family transcriptional regulator, maltose regulon positive regulatory protein